MTNRLSKKMVGVCLFFLSNILPIQATPVLLKASFDTNYIPVLTLKEAILLAVRNNPNVHNAELQRVMDKFALAVAHNQFAPQFGLSGQAIYQNNANSIYAASPIIKLLTPLGTQISTSLTQNVNNENNPAVSTTTAVTVTQPLLRGFGPAVNKINLFNAIDNEKINQLNFKNQIIGVIVAVVNNYYQLVQAYNVLESDKLSLQDAQNMLDQTVAKINAGKAAPADQIQQESSIAARQLSISNDENIITQGYQNLFILIGLDPLAKLNIDKKITDKFNLIPPLNKCIEIALAHNIGYQQALALYKITERAVISAKDAQKWQLDATGAWNQFSNSLNGDPSSSKSLTLNLDIPLHDLSRQQQLVNAKIQQQQAQNNLTQLKDQLIVNVTNSYNNLNSNQAQVKLYENYANLAEKSLETAKIKFNYGKISTFELTSLQTSLANARLGFIAQRIQYLNLQESFYQLLGTTLNKWGIDS